MWCWFELGGIKSWNGYTQVQTILATHYSDSIWALWQTKGREVHTWLWEAWSCFAQKSELLISSYFPCMCFRIRKSSDSEMSREQTYCCGRQTVKFTVEQCATKCTLKLVVHTLVSLFSFVYSSHIYFAESCKLCHCSWEKQLRKACRKEDVQGHKKVPYCRHSLVEPL